jgi:hypothetical protein
MALSGCSDEPSKDESLKASLALAVEESKAVDGEVFLAVAWSEDGSRTLEAIQELTMPFLSPTALPKLVRSGFLPGTYSNEGGIEAGSGICYFVWEKVPETRADIVGKLKELNSSSPKSSVVVITE